LLMPRLSKATKTRLDEAVMLSVSRLHDDPRPLQTLHFSRPDKFALSISKYIINHWDVRDLLLPDDFMNTTIVERVEIVDASVKRLYRRGRLRREDLKVPVMLGRNSGKQYLETRMMSCYWPANILDHLASC